MIPRVALMLHWCQMMPKVELICHTKCENEGGKSIFLNILLKYFKYFCIIVYYRHLIIPLVSLEFYISKLPQNIILSLRKREDNLIFDIEGINSLPCLCVGLGSLIRILCSKRERGM